MLTAPIHWHILERVHQTIRENDFKEPLQSSRDVYRDHPYLSTQILANCIIYSQILHQFTQFTNLFLAICEHLPMYSPCFGVFLPYLMAFHIISCHFTPISFILWHFAPLQAFYNHSLAISNHFTAVSHCFWGFPRYSLIVQDYFSLIHK